MSKHSLNGIDVDGLKAFSEEVKGDSRKGIAEYRVSTRWQGQTRTVAAATQFTLGAQTHQRQFDIAADEPEQLLGTNTAPTPQELMMAGLNACVSVTYVAYAAAMDIKIDALEIDTDSALDLRGFLGIDPDVKPGFEEVRFTVRLRTSAPKERVEELHRVALATSPNLSSFSSAIRMVPTLVIEGA